MHPCKQCRGLLYVSAYTVSARALQTHTHSVTMSSLILLGEADFMLVYERKHDLMEKSMI